MTFSSPASPPTPLPTVWPAPAATTPVNALVPLPGSKSLTARHLIMAAIADRPTMVRGALRSRDTELMVGALRALGIDVVIDPEGTGDSTSVLITPPPASTGPRLHGGVSIDCGLAGTVMRFVPALVLLADAPVTFDGDPAARHRPMGPLLEALTSLGARITYDGEAGFMPFTITPPHHASRPPASVTSQGTSHRTVTVDASTSSQFVSALLLVASALPGGLEIRAPHPVVSLPHIEMTVEALRSLGAVITCPGDITSLDAEDTPTPADGACADLSWKVEPQALRGGEVTIEPDLSNAGPFLAAALITGGQVRVPSWPVFTTQAGDAWREILPRMGGAVGLHDESHLTATRNDGTVTHGAATLTLSAVGTGQVLGIDADLSTVGELAPTVAALATVAAHQGHGSHLRGIAHLRGHETNRLAALVTEIQRLGGVARETPDGIVIEPATLHPARLATYGDHRMATFAAIVGLAVPGVEIEDVETTSKTLPGFTGMWEHMLAQKAQA